MIGFNDVVFTTENTEEEQNYGELGKTAFMRRRMQPVQQIFRNQRP
jgi:hypothetical protein